MLLGIAKLVVVVVESFHESVREVLKDYKVTFARQKKRLGTAHATEIGLGVLKKLSPPPSEVLVCYGDHTMFYKKDVIRNLVFSHQKTNASVSLITSSHPDIDTFAWGRILRDKKNNVIGIVEQKDATLKERKIREFNPGFYCFNFEFLKKTSTK